MRRLTFPFIALIAAAGLATGCASTATGTQQSSAASVPDQTLRADLPTGGVAAVIRYPAIVAEDAQDAYREAYAMQTIGGTAGRDVDAFMADNIADAAIVKSNYFALSLFKEMAAELPAHGVVLSPHIIRLDDEGRLTSEPVTQAETLPSAVSVDFATYSLPDPDKMMGNAPLTFGDLVTPLVSVRTDHLASAPTQGVLLASSPLTGVARRNGRASVGTSMEAIQDGTLLDAVPPLDFVAYLNGDTRRDPNVRSMSLSADDNAIQTYPVEKILLDRDALNVLDDGEAGATDPLESAFSRGFADRIVAMINRTDVEAASAVARAAAISEFDPDLGALTFSADLAPDEAARLRYAERLLDAQRNYLSVQSLRVFDGIHNGEMGAQVRDMILAERNVLERRRELARKQNMATALSVLGTVAAVAVASQSAENTSGAEDAVGSLAVQGTIFAITEAVNLNRESKAVGENYLTSIIPALDEQTTVQIDLLDSNETITAIRYEDLQAKLQTLYAESQRSLDNVTSRCAYTPLDAGRGTWMGSCAGGVANGAGVGIVRDAASGTAQEYYGTARNGRPEGTGLLIRHSAAGSESLRGTFADGLPDGVVEVARAGRPDETRLFRAGQDVGASSARAPSPFDALADNAVRVN